MVVGRTSGSVICHSVAHRLGLVLLSDRGSALGRATADKQVRLVRGDREALGLRGRQQSSG